MQFIPGYMPGEVSEEGDVDAGSSGSGEEDKTWPVKRPRGYNPAIGRGDLQSMAAAAAVIASTRPPEPGSIKGPRTSCYRSAVDPLLAVSLHLPSFFGVVLLSFYMLPSCMAVLCRGEECVVS